MKISVLIPQLFYDVIGRIIPGATLIATAFFLFEGAMKGRRHLTTWTTSTDDISVPVVFVILGNLLGSHVVGSLLGGLWFRLYRIDLIKHGEEQCTHKWLKCLHGWAKNGETRLDNLNKTFKESLPVLADIDMTNMDPSGRIALMYDYIQLRCPNAGARIAKLRAEQHMSGVLLIGFIILASLYLFFPSLRQPEWSLWAVEITLLVSALIAGSLAWHLEKRSGTALFYSWFLVSSGIAEEDRKQDSKIR